MTHTHTQTDCIIESHRTHTHRWHKHPGNSVVDNLPISGDGVFMASDRDLLYVYFFLIINHYYYYYYCKLHTWWVPWTKHTNRLQKHIKNTTFCTTSEPKELSARSPCPEECPFIAQVTLGRSLPFMTKDVQMMYIVQQIMQMTKSPRYNRHKSSGHLKRCIDIYIYTCFLNNWWLIWDS